MLRTEPIPFGAWEPDAISVRPHAAEVIENVVPVQDGYAPLEAPSRVGIGVPDAPYSASQFLIEGVPVLMVGTANSVYRIQGESRALIGSGFTATEEYGWGFDLFDDQFVAGNVNDGIFKAEAQNGTLQLITGAPKARLLREFEGFLFALQVSGYPARMQWSGFRNIDTWTPDAATQSDIQDMPSELGDIRGASGAPYLSIYQRNGISRGTFVGGATVFRFDTLERNKGLLATKSLVSTGKYDFFLSEDGFNIWDGRQAHNIDEDRTKDWFEQNCTEANRYFVKGAVDYRRKLIIWTWPDSPYFLIYSYRHNRWVRGKYPDGFDTTGLFQVSAPKPGIDLDTDAPGEAADLDAPDALPDSYDDPYWRHGSYQSGFLNNGDLSLFTGAAMEAILETADSNPIAGRMTNIHAVWPLLDAGSGSSIAASVGAKLHQIGDTVSYSAEETMDDAGVCPVRQSGRFFRARLRVPAGETWNNGTGVQLGYVDGGAR